MKNKWYRFEPNKASNLQKLPQRHQKVLVLLDNLEVGFPNLIVIGYLEFHAGVRSEPYFVTPGASIKTVVDDSRVIAWCDGLTDDFLYPSMKLFSGKRKKGV